MQPEIAQKLIDLNRDFYHDFGRAFAATRRRIQPGIQYILKRLPEISGHDGTWLDIGCGSGSLASAWAAHGRYGSYIGLDFSAQLLEEAEKVANGLRGEGLSIRFLQVDLGQEGWSLPVQEEKLDGVLAFAVLHHLPAFSLRQQILTEVRSLLPVGGWFIHSEWQFQHSPRLMERRQPWELIGLCEADVEPGDTLLDWRHTLPGEVDQTGYRYVHLFDRAELAHLAAACGFKIIEEFESDGQGGKLGLYQLWQAQ